MVIAGVVGRGWLLFCRSKNLYFLRRLKRRRCRHRHGNGGFVVSGCSMPGVPRIRYPQGEEAALAIDEFQAPGASLMLARTVP